MILLGCQKALRGGFREVLQVDQWTTIRYIRSHGKSIREIAREVGVHPQTVRRALASEGRPKYKPRAPRPNAELEQLRPELERMLF